MNILREKHASKHSVEQLNAWAHMIQMGKHASTEEPPALPYFGKARAPDKGSPEVGAQSILSSSPQPLSPGKRITLRSERIDQLGKWHSLLEKGVIIKTKYEELQETILGDMSNL